MVGTGESWVLVLCLDLGYLIVLVAGCLFNSVDDFLWFFFIECVLLFMLRGLGCLFYLV